MAKEDRLGTVGPAQQFCVCFVYDVGNEVENDGRKSSSKKSDPKKTSLRWAFFTPYKTRYRSEVGGTLKDRYRTQI